MAMMPVMPVMMVPAPVMMAMPMVPMAMPIVAVMPAPIVAVVPSPIAHLDEAGVRQPGYANSRAEVGGCGGFWRSHEQTQAQSQPNRQSPEHIVLL